MSPVWASASSWKCSYKNKGVCYIRTEGAEFFHTKGDGSWSITLYDDNSDDYNSYVVNGNYQDIVWNNRALKKCHRCHPQKCAPKGNEETFLGFKKIFYGKEFENVCCNGDTSFLNPNERMLNYIKGVIDIRRQYIDKNKI